MKYRFTSLALVWATIALLLLVGCGESTPPEYHYAWHESSVEEALYVASHVDDFDRVLFYANIRVGSTNALIENSADDYFPAMYHPSFADTVQVQFTHMLLVAKQGGTYWTVIMDDNRPPEIVGEFQIDLDRELDYENYDF
ncbi:hypothetical protein HOB10_01355 [Candidatus Parcubacteria bacterium]|nr:hypothetical protein [Candidatus Parcubacteria bacterium]